MIKDLIVNGSLIISFLFLAGQFFKNHPLLEAATGKARFIAGMMGGVLGSILMLFTIHVTGHLIADMRNLALILITIYGGIPGSLVAIVLMGITRIAMFGLNSASITAVVVLLMLSASCIAIMKIKRWSFHKKYWMMNAINLGLTFTAFYILLDVKDQLPKLYLSVGLITLGTALYSYVVVQYIGRSNELFRRYERESKLDFLTGLINVRQFNEIYHSQFRSAKERKEQLSVLMIDIDHFKNINDTYGHAAGDLVLKKLGAILMNTTRHFDIAARKGGEEFTVLLLDCPLQRAAEIAEKIRSAVEQAAFPILSGNEIHITVSIGAAAFPDTTEDVQELLHYADRALYSAKHTGRNRVAYRQA